MSYVPSPAEIRNTKQPIPTDKLVRWAEESGFEVRRSGRGTSHINCRHKIYTDIHFGIIVNSTSLGSQRCLSDCLLEIQNREAAKKDAFTKAAQQKITDQYAKLPEYLSVEHDFEKGVSVLRDKALPQIGVTIPFAEARILENKIKTIDDVRRQAYELLGRARTQYDAKTSMDKGEFNGALEHPVYKISAPELPPYRAGENPTKLLEHIYGFCGQVMETDKAHETRLGSILKQDFVGAVKVAFQALRGERHNYVPIEKPDGSSFVFMFKTASNARAFNGDIQRGRISEEELARVERVIGGIGYAHAHSAPAALRVA